jgi:glycosyltransferase involved in cell wall biosynthesis
MTTVAVLMLTYNHQAFLQEALEGIRTQTRTPDEVVISDDGSTDSTQQMLRDYVERHALHHWHLMLSPINRGIPTNLQSAIDRVTADIIVPMAGDDVSLPNRCEEAERAFADHPGVNIICTDGYVIDDTGRRLREVSRRKGMVQDVELAVRRGSSLLSPIGQSWRRTLFQQFGALPTDVPNEDDQITFWGLLTGGVMCLPAKTFEYRVHGSSASAWLRTRLSSAAYFDRFVRDMDVRERHMRHWQESLERTSLPNRRALQELAGKKAAIYNWLKSIGTASLAARIRFVLSNASILTLRDLVYCVLGRTGIVGWRDLRHLLRRA